MTSSKSFVTIVLWLLFAGFSGSLLVFSGLYLYLSPKLPSVESLKEIKFQTPLRIYSSDQQLIGEFGEKRRDPITYAKIPETYIQAILAAEDAQYYSHHGVSIKALARAASELLRTGRIKTGGSTITMQVARNFFLTRNQTFARKFNEILLALQIEQELSKEEILELYVNKIYLGNRAYGIQAAARVYYGQDIGELDLAQLAMIAGLPKAPSAYNPIANPTRALQRRNWILGRMLELGKINRLAHDAARREPVSARYHGLRLDLDAPYVAEMARKQAIALFGESAYTDGYQVFTSVDSALQQSAQAAVRNGLLSYDQRHGYRGPELQLQDSSPAGQSSNSPALDEPTLRRWRESLRALPRFAGLLPAAVIRVGEQEVEALLERGDTIVIPWEGGLSDARAYINENKRGPKPKIAADIVAVGDVIRTSENAAGNWRLQQIPAAQAAMVALNPENGGIQSLVGGFDFYQSHFNRATQAARQPGSNFKPFVYTAALENGFTAATLVNDAPIVIDDASLEGTWRPDNSSGKFLGPTRLRKALYQSRNLVSIRVLRGVGIPRAIAAMDRFGLDRDKLPRDLSLALGSYALTPLEVARGYAIFANGGYRIEPFLVERIEDSSGQSMYQHLPLTVCRDCDKPATTATPETATEAEFEPGEESGTLEQLLGLEEISPAHPPASDTASPASETAPEPVALQLPRAPRVLNEQVAYIIDSMLRDVVQKGTGRRARVLERDDLAGKTGTTNGPRDVWFSGYTPQIVATTWLGFDQNTLVGRREFGGSAALPIWIDYMRSALKDVPEQPRRRPNGLVTVLIDPKTGERVQPGSPNAIFEIFRAENTPKIADTLVRNSRKTSADEPETRPEELF